MCRGKAELLMDDATRAHAWDALDYDLKGFFPGGAYRPELCGSESDTPSRVELSEMFGACKSARLARLKGDGGR